VGDVKRQLQDSPGPHFGSRYQEGGLSTQPPDLHFSEEQQALALDIFVFDTLIRNVDRTHPPGKPNILRDGDHLYLIDHELAFSFIYGNDIPDPCDLRKETFFRRHIFYDSLHRRSKREDLEFEECFARFAELNEGIIEEIISQVPENWYNGDNSVTKITTYLEKACGRIEELEQSIREVLA
jgi:hypothetical protein